MELSWLMRLRIAAAAATGVILIGILGWPLAAPPEPSGAVSLVVGGISFGDTIAIMFLAFLSGLIAYFLCWPYGREIGIVAAPSGLAVWALRTGSMAGLLRLNPTLAQRQALFATLKWEPVFWLAIVAAGFAGVLSGRKIRSKPDLEIMQQKCSSKSNIYLNAITALVGSVLMAQFLIGLFAQDVKIFDIKLGTIVSQPAVGQIAFAVVVSFGLVAFAIKTFLNVSYIWPTIASAFVTAFAIIAYVRRDILQHLIGHYPAVFFSHAAVSILPVQMVAFGTLGAIAGYWLAVRYNYWRKHSTGRLKAGN